MHARLHHEVLAHVLYSLLVRQFEFIVETVILSVVMKKDTENDRLGQRKEAVVCLKKKARKEKGKRPILPVMTEL